MAGKSVRKNRADLVSVTEAAAILGIASSTVYYRISTGVLPAWRERGKRTLLLDRREVERSRDSVSVVRE